MLAARAFHFLLSPTACLEQVEQLHFLRHAAGIQARPVIAWEPMPLFCGYEQLPALYEAAKHVTILSPNHIELAKFHGETNESTLTSEYLEHLAAKMVQSGISHDGKGLLVIRAGERGCLIAGRDIQQGHEWYPAYHGASNTGSVNAVVDATGAGNAFLGAFAVELGRSGDRFEAVVRASVAASFVVEQLGLPVLGLDGDGNEIWNGQKCDERLEIYRELIKSV